MKWKMIAAMDDSRLIGKDNRLPWRIPEDIAWYQSQTDGQILLMGRKTFEGIRRRPEGTRYIVVSRSLYDQQWQAPNVTVIDDLNALKAMTFEEDVWVCGGGSIYEMMLDQADELILSLVSGVHEGDTYFPNYEETFAYSETLLEHGAFRVVKYVKK